MSRISVTFCGFVVATMATGLLNCRPPSNPTVLNGTLHESATLDVSAYTRIVVPDTANVQEGSHLKSMEIHIEKELAFYGHPAHPVHIEKARKYFGVAKREDDRVLLLGTYGEWSSKEGGARVRMDIVVPLGTVVEKRHGLSGEDSSAKPRGTDSEWARLVDSKEFRKCYWYTSISPGEGWVRVETVP